jgi:hypothetical protein
MANNTFPVLLKHVLAKTGATSQPDLMRLVVGNSVLMLGADADGWQ